MQLHAVDMQINKLYHPFDIQTKQELLTMLKGFQEFNIMKYNCLIRSI